MSGLTCFPFSLATSLTAAQYCPNRGILWDQISEPSVIIAKLKADNNWDAPNSFHPHSHKLGYQFSEPSISGWWFGPCFIFPLGIIIPTDEVIFFRGVGQPPSRLLLTIIDHILTIY